MPDRITVTQNPSEKVVVIAIDGDEPITIDELWEALAPLDFLNVDQYMAYQLVGFTPGHFIGWPPEWWSSVDTLMCDGTSNGEGPDWFELIVVGCLPPSPERLAELLSHPDDKIRELALTWMAPRVSAGWSEFDAALDAVREDVERSGAASMTERELIDAAEAAKQGYRKEKRERGK